LRILLSPSLDDKTSTKSSQNGDVDVKGMVKSIIALGGGHLVVGT
jgi:hypothetical protein